MVEGDEGYRAAKHYMRMLMPSHARRVKPYKDRIPLFYRYQVESQLDAMHSPIVQLRSGGYLVVHVTEALVPSPPNMRSNTTRGFNSIGSGCVGVRHEIVSM